MPARRSITILCLALSLLLLVAVPARAGCTLVGELLTCTPEGLHGLSGPGGSPPPDSVGAGVYPEGARRLLELANQERAAVGLGLLTSRPDLVELALRHTQAMVQDDSIFHNLNLLGKPLRALLGASVVGENVGWSTDIEDLHRRLMASAGHRASLLEPRFSVVGMAVVRSENGRYYATQDFAQPDGGPTLAPPSTTPPPPPAPRRPVAVPPPVVEVAPAAPLPRVVDAPPVAEPVLVTVPEVVAVPEREPVAPPAEGAVAGLLSATPVSSSSADRRGLVALAAILAALVGLGNGLSAVRNRHLGIR